MAYRRPHLVPLVLVAVLATGACSHGKPTASPSASLSGSPTASESATPSATGSSGAPAPSGGPSGSATGTRAPGSSGGATTPGTHPSPSAPASSPPPLIPVKLTLAHSCVRPGGTQVASVSTLPGALVVLDTKYSDNKDGSVHGGLKSDGKADDGGHFSFTWTVLPGTPTGEATTYAASATKERKGYDTKKFTVALTC